MMSEHTNVRLATLGDLPRLTEIYNHYVVNSPATFDLEPLSLEQRRLWFDEHAETGPHRIYIAEEDGRVLGYASSSRFRSKSAYDTTIETSVYCDAEATGRGLGTLLYQTLFEALRGEDLQTAIAGATLPNPASVRLHERFDFQPVGVMHAVGYKFGRYWDVAWFEKALRE